MLRAAQMHPRPFVSRIGHVLVVAGVLAVAAACGTTSVMVPAAKAPAAVGKIRANVDGNNNTVLNITADHLAQPTRLAPNLTAYVVWIRPAAGGDFINAGRLVPDANGAASLKTSTAWKDVEVVVTVEETPAAQRPAEFVLLRGYASPRQ